MQLTDDGHGGTGAVPHRDQLGLLEGDEVVGAAGSVEPGSTHDCQNKMQSEFHSVLLKVAAGPYYKGRPRLPSLDVLESERLHGPR
jgi:hypothetical protein